MSPLQKFIASVAATVVLALVAAHAAQAAGVSAARCVPSSWKSVKSPVHSASELETKATWVPSGDHDGTLIVPWPPYT